MRRWASTRAGTLLRGSTVPRKASQPRSGSTWCAVAKRATSSPVGTGNAARSTPCRATSTGPRAGPAWRAVSAAVAALGATEAAARSRPRRIQVEKNARLTREWSSGLLKNVASCTVTTTRRDASERERVVRRVDDPGPDAPGRGREADLLPERAAGAGWPPTPGPRRTGARAPARPARRGRPASRRRARSSPSSLSPRRRPARYRATPPLFGGREVASSRTGSGGATTSGSDGTGRGADADDARGALVVRHHEAGRLALDGDVRAVRLREEAVRRSTGPRRAARRRAGTRRRPSRGAGRGRGRASRLSVP